MLAADTTSDYQIWNEKT